MSTITNGDVLKVVAKFVEDGKTFSAFDVTQTLRKRFKNLKHSEVRNLVPLIDFADLNYDKTLTTVKGNTFYQFSPQIKKAATITSTPTPTKLSKQAHYLEETTDGRLRISKSIYNLVKASGSATITIDKSKKLVYLTIG